MPSGVERVPALVLCFSGAGRVGVGGCVVVPRELVVARCTRVLVGDAPAVRGAEATNDPAIFDRRLYKSDGVLLVVGGAGAGTARASPTSTPVQRATTSSQGTTTQPPDLTLPAPEKQRTRAGTLSTPDGMGLTY